MALDGSTLRMCFARTIGRPVTSQTGAEGWLQ
jgi:hypothetical protein